MGRRLVKIVLILAAIDALIALATMWLLSLRLSYDVAACSNGAFFCFPPTLVYGIFSGVVFTIAAVPITIFLLGSQRGLENGAEPRPSWVPVVVYLVFGAALPLGVFMYNTQSWLDHNLSDWLSGSVFGLSALFFWWRTPLTARMREWTLALIVGMLAIAIAQFFIAKSFV